MSRLNTLSPAALKAMFSPDSSDTLVTLITIYDPQNPTAVVARIADGYTQRISETVRDVVYGVVSRGENFIFLPVNITLPSEEDTAAPRCSLSISDVTKHLVPLIRTINGPPKVMLELVMASTPDVVEASFPGFYITNFTYNAETVQAELAMINYSSEPFPAYTFTPQYFPGLF